MRYVSVVHFIDDADVIRDITIDQFLHWSQYEITGFAVHLLTLMILFRQRLDARLLAVQRSLNRSDL